MNRLAQFFCLSIIFFSCSKSEKDFTGKYEILYPSHIKISNKGHGLGAFYNSQPEKHTAREYYELLPFKLNFFIDETEGKLKGEAEMSYTDVVNMRMNPSVTRKKMDFSILDIRLENDTLGFQIENELLKLSGKKIKGQLIKKDNESVLGLELESVGLNDYTEKNPLFILNNEEMIYYRTVSPGKAGEIKKKFYKVELEDLSAKLKTAKTENDKIYFQNSIAEVQSLK